jgi:hypothetical protein
MIELLRLREINDPVFDTPVPTEMPDYIPGPFDGEKEGYTFCENGPKGPGYYRDFIPVADRKSGSGDKDGYVFMPDGPQGQGYYKLPDDGKAYYIPGDFDGPKDGYQYRKKGPLGDGYYLDDEYMPGLRKFKVKNLNFRFRERQVTPPGTIISGRSTITASNTIAHDRRPNCAIPTTTLTTPPSRRPRSTVPESRTVTSRRTRPSTLTQRLRGSRRWVLCSPQHHHHH